MQLLRQLKLDTAEFKDAVDQSYESGNQYWMWQRMVKHENIIGGILSIGNDRFVELHDHPGATGMIANHQW